MLLFFLKKDIDTSYQICAATKIHPLVLKSNMHDLHVIKILFLSLTTPEGNIFPFFLCVYFIYLFSYWIASSEMPILVICPFLFYFTF